MSIVRQQPKTVLYNALIEHLQVFNYNFSEPYFIFISSLPLKTPGNQNENHAHQLNIIIKLNQGGQFAIFNIVNLETNTKELFY